MTALEVVPFAMLIVDSAAEALAVNAKWTEISGLDRADSVGAGWLSVLEPESRARLRETVLRIAAEGGTGTIDLQVASGTRARWVRWWASRHEVDNAALIAVAAADIDDDYARQASLYHRATHDALTGLVNRSHFMECTDQALRRSARQQRHVAVVYVDLDGFKRVNDRGGHSLGDRVLYAIAARLRHAVRSADMMARIGGDEFAVLCEGLIAGEQADVVARRIASALTESVELDGQRWPVAASVGTAVDRGEIEAAETLVDRADQAMYTVKLTRRPTPSAGPGPLSARRSSDVRPPAGQQFESASGSSPRYIDRPDTGWVTRRQQHDAAFLEPEGDTGWVAEPAAPATPTEPAQQAPTPPSHRVPVDSAHRAPAPPSRPAPAEPAHQVAAEPAHRVAAEPAHRFAAEPSQGAPAERAAAPPSRRAGTLPAPDAPGRSGPTRYSVLDAEEARRALRELVESGERARRAGTRASAGTTTTPSAPGSVSTVAPPAPAPAGGASGGAGEQARDRLAHDVMSLRDSIDSIRQMLDRLLGDELGGDGVIDIRERAPD